MNNFAKPIAKNRSRLEQQQPGVGATQVDLVNRMIRGCVVAQAGPFKTQGRGEFDMQSLKQIVALWPLNGLKSRFAHPTESSDGIGTFVGRMHRPRLSKTKTGISCVRADLQVAESAFWSPYGNLGNYIFELAKEDSDALSSSLVLCRDCEYRRRPDGRMAIDNEGEPLPPLWRPTELHACDLVDEGEAVDGLLSTRSNRLTYHHVNGISKTIDALLSGQQNAGEQVSQWLRHYQRGEWAALPAPLQAMAGQVHKDRVAAFAERYLEHRQTRVNILRRKLELKAKAYNHVAR